MTPIRIVRYIVLQRRQRRRSSERTGVSQLLRILSALLLVVLLVIVGTFASGVSAVAGAYSYFTRDLPEPEQIEAAGENFETTKVYDRTGQVLLYEVIDPFGGDRTWVVLDQIPESLVCATVAIEDRNYWENPGINLRGIGRAAWADIQGKQIQGGSSITQQLIKSIVIEEELRYVSAEGPEWKDYDRKITEILLAYRISQKYSKEKILEWYLNTNFYGNLAYGIEAAARVYFGKSVGDLTLAESATLAAIPQFPVMNPFDNPDLARERQHLVLNAMEGQGCITPAEAVAAKYEEWELAHLTERYDILAPHFSVYVRKQLEEMFNPEMVYRGGLRVYTTLDLELQEQALCVARAQVRRLSGEEEELVLQEAITGGCEAAQFLPPLRSYDVGRDHEVDNAAVAAIRPATGEILAMVGSLDYWDETIDGHFNVAVDGYRQPGSSFKPFTYLTLLSQGDNAAHMFLDVRRAFQQPTGVPYVPENYDRKYHGPQLMRTALARSYNIPAVEALYLSGVDNVIRTAHRMGINTLDRGLDYYGLSLTLGGGEVHLLDMIYAFGVFANSGRMYGEPVPEDQLRTGYRELNPVAILRVEDRNGNVLYEYTQPESREILSPQLAYLMNSILSDRRARWAGMGMNNALELSNDRPAAAKTGTTNDFRDAWTVGYTPQLAVGVWVGNSDNSEMKNLPGLRGASPIWHAVMEYALQDEEIVPFTRPDGLIERAVCAVSGKLPGPNCPTVNELFIPGAEPTEHCHMHQTFSVNRETGRLCTVHTPPELCEEHVYEVYPPEAADWIASLDEDRRPPIPPTEYDTIYGPSLSDAEVAIISPGPYSYIGGTVPITGNARGGDFAYYRVLFGEGLNPGEWIQIGPEHGNQVDHNLLEFWDTRALDGLYSLRISVVDHSTALRETTVQVTVDNISPTLDLTHPYDGSAYEVGYDEWANVNAEVQDYSIARVEFYEYPGGKENEPPAELQPFAVRIVAPFNVNWPIGSIGKHTFYVIAVDAAGNANTSERVSIHVVPRAE
ncbi:MAG: transglycosylase domain-containing protein [Chloroflexota bacterium]|nr:transglycosylase domain-containing protein [Chloroflexota bacterium]